MAKQGQDRLYVIAAYDQLYAAIDDYETIEDLYRQVRALHDFTASVLAKDEYGEVRIVKKHEQSTRHLAAVGLGWGLAVGVAEAMFAPIGTSIAAAAGAGAAIGVVVDHVRGRMSRGGLKDLGETLDAGQAGLFVVYEASFANQIGANIWAANSVISGWSHPYSRSCARLERASSKYEAARALDRAHSSRAMTDLRR